MGTITDDPSAAAGPDAGDGDGTGEGEADAAGLGDGAGDGEPLGSGVGDGAGEGDGDAASNVKVYVPRSMCPSSDPATQRTSYTPGPRSGGGAMRRTLGSAGSTRPRAMRSPAASRSDMSLCSATRSSSNVAVISIGGSVIVEPASGELSMSSAWPSATAGASTNRTSNDMARARRIPILGESIPGWPPG